MGQKLGDPIRDDHLDTVYSQLKVFIPAACDYT